MFDLFYLIAFLGDRVPSLLSLAEIPRFFVNFAVDCFLIIWRVCVFFVGETAESTPKVDLSLRFGLPKV